MFLAVFRFLLLGSCTIFAFVLDAQEFSDLEAQLLEHPSLAQMDYQAVAIRERAVAAVALPDPSISLGVNNVPVASPSFDRFLPSNKSVGIHQQFPNLAGRQARSAAIHEKAKQMDAESARRFAKLRAELVENLVQLERIDEQRALAEQQLAKYEELTEVAKAEIDAGRPVVFRLSEITGKRAKIGQKLVELQGEEAVIHTALIEKVGYVPSTVVPSILAADFTGDAYQFHAVRVAELGTRIAQEGIAEAHAGWKTQWGVELSYQQRTSGRGEPYDGFRGDDWFSAKVTFSVPLWGKRKQAPNVRAAHSEKESALADVQATSRQSVAQFKRLRAIRKTAQYSRVEIQKNIDAVTALIQSQRTQYEAGAGDYAPIIDSEIAVLMLREQLAIENARLLSATTHSNALLVSL